MNKWINIKETQPPFDTWILVYANGDYAICSIKQCDGTTNKWGETQTSSYIDERGNKHTNTDITWKPCYTKIKVSVIDYDLYYYELTFAYEDITHWMPIPDKP